MYPLKFHKTLNVERWSAFPTDQQLLMISNELSRILSGIKAKGSWGELKACMERAFELVDLTVELARPALQKELLRWRTLFGEFYLMSEEDLRHQSENIKKLLQALLFLSPGSARCKP